MNQPKRLMVMAGGTGGHVFPGLAVAHHLMEQGWQVRWLGTADRMEADLVPKHGIEIDFIRISGLRGKGIKALLLAPVRIFNAWRQARDIMKRFKPDVVLGMGGYVSGPGGLAAWSLGIPVVLHEQNGIAGLTNKWLAKIATKVMQAFPGAFPKADVVGNPVRVDVLALPLPDTRLAGREGPVRVLVVGGSQGARILNQTMPQVATKLGDAVTIWHQSGKGAQQSVEQAYAQEGQPQHKVTEFIDDMAAAYAWADVVVCRSGALTVSEIAAAGCQRCLCRSSTKTDSSTGMRCRLRKRVPQKFLSSHNLPLMRSPLPWRAGTEMYYWRWRNAHARPLSRMQRNGWQKK